MRGMNRRRGVNRRVRASEVRAVLETFTGKLFTPLAPNFADIDVLDIAHALSHQCRFSGHTRLFYSVAEHSVRVARLLKPRGKRVQLWGLLHDASEAYLVDLPTPLKRSERIGVLYTAAEKRLMRAICKRFCLPWKEPASVRAADLTMLATEVNSLMPGALHERPWTGLPAPLNTWITPWSSTAAKEAFLNMFAQLGGVYVK